MSNHSIIHRGRNRKLSAAPIFMLAIFMLGILLGHPAYSAPSVPWLNQPAQAKSSAAPAAVPSAHPCAGNDLRIAAGPAGAYRGQATQELRLANTSADACYLTGFPNVQLLPASGAPQTVGASDAAPNLANQRVELAPGDEVVMLIGTPGVCEAANGPQRKVNRRLQVALPGGGVKVVEGVHVDTLCGRATVVQLQAVRNEAAAQARTKSGSPLNQLAGTISAPDDAARGGALRYTVTLSNPTDNAVPLAPCPTYTQSLYADGQALDTTWRLNCAAAGAQIPAHASVSFEMQAQVPADFAAGNLKLSWKLQDGPGVGKIISLR